MRMLMLITAALGLGLAPPATAAGSGWLQDFGKALKKAEKSAKPLLVEFSQSDTNERCQKLNKEVFWKSEFKTWARKNVILVHVDFPTERFQSEKKKAAAEELKKRYKVERFPTVLILGPSGEEVGRLGYTEGGAKSWLAKVAPMVEGASGAGEWITDWEKAVKLSRATGKPILADFTGSDWCGWCKKLKAEVFDKEEFKGWAKRKVILVELDFPRTIKQSDKLKKQNEELRQKYSVRGYPTILFLDAKGKVLYKSGYKKGGPKAWIEDAESNLK